MYDFVYDDSFQGYLTAIFKVYESKALESQICRRSLYNGHLFNEQIEVVTEPMLANRVMKGILEKLGEEWIDMLHKVFLSEDETSDTLGFKAVQLGLCQGKQLLNDERHEIIQPFLKLGRKVARETHNFLGYIRFSKLTSGIYYCEFQPTYNILPLLAPHFADRLKDQSWVIHDSKRGVAAFYDQQTWHLNPLTHIESLSVSEEELHLQGLWRGYFESLAISERTNLKLQQQKIPKKYWRFFTEDIGVLTQHDIMERRKGGN